MAQSYVKALYDYHSGEAGDLNFKSGDIIEILNQVGDNWIEGKHGGDIGLFPANFVEPTTVDKKTLSAIENIVSDAGGQIVIAKETYINGDEGVLTFFRGDELTFFGYVDDYWCRGSCLGEVGHFPAYLVDGLQDAPSSPQTVVTPKTIPLHENATQPTPQKPHAKSLFDFKGLSDFELSFPASQIIFLTKDIDDEWFEGNYNGNTGIFPKTFVEVLVALPDSLHVGPGTIDVPYAIAVYPFVGDSLSELSFREGDIIILHHWVSPEWIQGECNGHIGIFPSTFVQIEIELSQGFEELSEEGTTFESGGGLPTSLGGERPPSVQGVVDSLFKTGDKALAIYNYAADIEGDLQLEVGDLIWIEQVIDDEWVLGRKDENVGLCPAVFLELQPDDELKNSAFEIDSFTSKKSELSADVYSSEQVLHEGTKSQSLIDNGDAQYKEIEQGNRSESMNLVLSNSMTNNATSPGSAKPSLNHIPSATTKPNTIVPTITSTPEVYHDSPEDQASQTMAKTRPSNVNTTSMVKPATLLLGPKPTLGQKPLISPKPDFLKKSVKPVLLPKPVTPTEKSPGFLKQNTENNWVTFEDQNEDSTFTQPTATVQHKSRPTAPSRSKISGKSPSMSYKTLLDKSFEDDLTTPLYPESSKGRPPVPPPRVDLVAKKSSLSSKLVEQANEFEKSSSRQSSPSLNELRELSKLEKPIPAIRSRHPLKPLVDTSNIEQGFPILHKLDEQITKLNNELQKEDKVLSGIEVLIQTVNEDTPRRGELESNKIITERKIEDLKRQLKKAQDQKKRLVKRLAGYASQEEISLKIQQLQESIKENTETKKNLQSLLSECEEDEVRNELQDNITFCDEAIKNLKSELDSLLQLVAELEGKVLIEDLGKDVLHRKKVIDEILNTEKSFARDLNLCLKNFMMQLLEWKVDIIDCDLLFGNMDEVAALSSRLLQRLETAINDIDINDQIIGTCFVDFSEEITFVYGKYCRNHDEAIAFLEKSSNNEEIQKYFRKCLESIREFSNCWDLSSFLIKPVQRILKYPLLLNELLKNTPDDHPDKPGLIKAIEVMTIAANDVNEFKRRKELVQKYQKVEDSGLSTKFQKFTWHSVVKKSSRFNQRITQFTGLVAQTVDEKFNGNERLFYQIEKTAKNLIKNITQYIEQFEDTHTTQVETAENITDFCKENGTAKEIHEYNDAQRFIGEDLVNKLKHVLDEEVLSPLNTLINLFQGPRRLIQKRHDKCLDYDSLSNKVEKIKDREKWRQAKDELEFAKKNYEALNAQLLDELPVLNTKSLKFLKTCIANFACVHKNFFVEALDQFSPSVQLSVINSDNVDIVSEFFSQNVLASHEIFQLAFTPKKSLTLTRPVRPNLSPKVSRSSPSVDEKYLKPKNLKRSASESKRKAPLPPASDAGAGLARSRTVSAADRSLLVRKRVEIDFEASSSSTADHPKNSSGNSTYIVKYTFNAEAPTELSVNKDDIIRVVQYHDAFGHSEWWKVEHNGSIGFVPSSFLVPYTISMVAQTRQTSNGMVLKSSMVDHLVKYDFEPHGPSELGVVSGEVVRVVKQSDTSGSKEWWMVEARGKQGYVPASYLVKRE